MFIEYLLFIFNCWYFWSFPIRFNFFFNEVVLNHNNYENLCMMVKRCKNKRDNDGTFIFSHSLSFHFSLLLQNCFLGLFQPILQTWCKVSNLFIFFFVRRFMPKWRSFWQRKIYFDYIFKIFRVMYNMDQFQQMLLTKLGNSSLFYL